MPRRQVSNNTIYDLMNDARLEQKDDLNKMQTYLETLINNVIDKRIVPLETGLQAVASKQNKLLGQVVAYGTVINLAVAGIISTVARKLWP